MSFALPYLLIGMSGLTLLAALAFFWQSLRAIFFGRDHGCPGSGSEGIGPDRDRLPEKEAPGRIMTESRIWNDPGRPVAEDPANPSPEPLPGEREILHSVSGQASAVVGESEARIEKRLADTDQGNADEEERR